jgi:hypothetical protein
MRRLLGFLFILVGVVQGALFLILVATHLFSGTAIQRVGIVLYAVGAAACLMEGGHLARRKLATPA